MKDHKCEVCGKIFSRKNDLTRHQSKKKKCKPRDESSLLKCSDCGELFAHSSSLSRHRQTCDGSAKSLRTEVAELRLEVQELRALQQGQNSTNSNSLNNNNNTSTTNNDNSQNIHIHINNYGKESTAHLDALTFEQLKDVLQLTPDNESLLRMLTFLHFNPEHPENHNLKLKDVDDEQMEIRKKGSWKEVQTDNTMFDVLSRQCLRFLDIDEKLKKGMSKAKYEALAKYLEDAEEMSNSENVKLHREHAFDELLQKAKETAAAGMNTD